MRCVGWGFGGVVPEVSTRIGYAEKYVPEGLPEISRWCQPPVHTYKDQSPGRGERMQYEQKK